MKTRNTLPKALSLGALVAVMVAIAAMWEATSVSAFERVDGTPDSGMGMITLIPGQNARLNVVNIRDTVPPNPDLSPDPMCRVEMVFYDSNGRQVGEPKRANLAPGQAFSGEVFDARTPGFDGAMQVRADVRGYMDPADGRRNRCSVIPTLEVFDQRTGGTLFLHPGLIKGFNPQPDPPKV